MEFIAGITYFEQVFRYICALSGFRLHSLCILQGGAEDFRGGSQIFRAKKGGI